MAGPDPAGRFSPDAFRTGIRAAKFMGLPQATADRPTFHFEDPATSGPSDVNGRPWDFQTATPTADPQDTVQVTCSIETREGEEDETSFGSFDAQELILGFFEDEWDEITGWTWVEIAGKSYKRSKPLPPSTLHDVTFRRVRVEALDV